MFEQIKNLKINDTFILNVSSKKIYSRGKYCRENKAFECTNIEDIADFKYYKGSKIVFRIDL